MRISVVRDRRVRYNLTSSRFELNRQADRFGQALRPAGIVFQNVSRGKAVLRRWSLEVGKRLPDLLG